MEDKVSRRWKVTLQGNPPLEVVVTTETSSLLQRLIALEIKQRLKELGHDHARMMDWEEADLTIVIPTQETGSHTWGLWSNTYQGWMNKTFTKTREEAEEQARQLGFKLPAK